MTDVTFTFRVDSHLKAAFVAIAEEQDLSAAQVLRRMMRQAVADHDEAAEHDRWQLREIADAMHEADVRPAPRLPSGEVDGEWEARKGEIGSNDDG